MFEKGLKMSKIEWTDETWNITGGCEPCSLGCEHCAAARSAQLCVNRGNKKYEGLVKNGKWTGEIRLFPDVLEDPLRWRQPRMIFTEFMGDLFHKSVPFEFIDKVMAVAMLCYTKHTFQILTKRPERMKEYFEELRAGKRLIGDSLRKIKREGFHNRLIVSGQLRIKDDYLPPYRTPPNLWLGVTIEHPDYKSRADILRQIPAAVRFLSIEPCLADMGELNLEGIDWVILGGESGPGARYCPVDNIRDVVGQCKEADVPVFVKQIHLWGVNWNKTLLETEEAAKLCTGSKMKLIKDINQFPEDLQIREYPK